MTVFVFDIDGTICTNTFGEYDKAKPFLDRIKIVNDLYDKGNTIKYFTARGSATGIDWRETTSKQLDKWNAKYHELLLGKPEGDLYIDDKGHNSDLWNWSQFKPMEIIDNENHHLINNYLNARAININKCIYSLQNNSEFYKVCNSAKKTFEKKGKIIFAGNGGSFADAQHLSAEFISKLKTDRHPLPAIALGTNSSSVTAVANDYGYEYVFSREFEAIGNENDLLIAISTSGNSKNIINLIEKAKSLGIDFFVLTGKDGGECARYKNIIRIQSEDTALIQEIHIIVGHIICTIAEQSFLKKSN